MINIKELETVNISEKLLNILLMDRTTRKNICWATENYMSYGSAYYPQEPITADLITGTNEYLIIPRVAKSIEEQTKRTKEKAEVFTPSWVCNMQNNLVDDIWFERSDVFNTSENKSWTATDEIITFPKNKNWRKYVYDRRLEICCGEAPYLISRYDTVTGEEIPIKERIGLLDRKLRVIGENTVTEDDWFEWTKKAFESTYGYEFQGDSLLIARKNMLYTFAEYMEHRFAHKPNEKQLMTIARIISWNIWQMDGLTCNVPYSERERVKTQLSILDFIEDENVAEKEPIPCRIYDWRAKESLEFKSMLKGNVK